LGNQGQAMIGSFMRMAAAGAIYLVVGFAVLTSVLAIWSSFHLTLRSIGHPAFVFLLTSACLGVPAFRMATTFIRRTLIRREGVIFHFLSTAALYLYVAFVVAVGFVHPPREGLEGGQIAFGLSAVVGVIGVAVNLLWVRRNRVSPTSRSTRSRVERAPG
jgi:hypothetical protein